MTTTSSSPYNTARSLKSSPRVISSIPAVNSAAVPVLKHVVSKSGGDISHVPPVGSSRIQPRPASSGGASASSSRSHTSNMSNRLKVSPYAVPLSTRSATEKPRSTPRPESTNSSRDLHRGDEILASHNPEIHPHVALSPIHAPQEPPISMSHHTHPRLSAPSLDILLLREGLDPTTVTDSDLEQPEGAAEIPGHDGSTFIEDIPANDPEYLSEPVERAIAPEPTPTTIDDPCIVVSEKEAKLSDELGQSLNKALEGLHPSAYHSQDSPSPSPIPLMNNLNLSQYSSAFAENLKGYCSDINSDISHRGDLGQSGNDQQSAGELEARYSVDVQVTSRLYEARIEDQDAGGLRHVRTRRSWFARIWCRGCMQEK